MTRIPKEPGRRVRAWNVRDTRRESSRERGYDAAWQRYSEQYRRIHPLCVPCRLAGRVRPSRCVDHIVPVHSCPTLFWEPDNHCAMCFSCHGFKTRKEPSESWEPSIGRVVVCGLPGTGKSTLARSCGVPYFDADELALESIEEIIHAREQWIAAREGACIVIVASIITASQLAARMRGVVKHMTEQFVER